MMPQHDPNTFISNVMLLCNSCYVQPNLSSNNSTFLSEKYEEKQDTSNIMLLMKKCIIGRYKRMRGKRSRKIGVKMETNISNMFIIVLILDIIRKMNFYLIFSKIVIIII